MISNSKRLNALNNLFSIQYKKKRTTNYFFELFPIIFLPYTFSFSICDWSRISRSNSFLLYVYTCSSNLLFALKELLQQWHTANTNSFHPIILLARDIDQRKKKRKKKQKQNWSCWEKKRWGSCSKWHIHIHTFVWNPKCARIIMIIEKERKKRPSAESRKSRLSVLYYISHRGSPGGLYTRENRVHLFYFAL